MRQLPARVRTRTVGATASEPDAGPSDPGLSLEAVGNAPQGRARRRPDGAKACGERLSSQVRAEGLAGRTSHGSRCLRRVPAGAPVAGHVRRHRQRRAGGGRLPPGPQAARSPGPTAAAPVHGGCRVRSSGAPRPRGREGVVQSASRTRPASGPQATAGAVLWRQSLRRLRAAFVSRQSDRAAVRPRRRNRSMRRLNLALGKAGSITPERFADSSSSSVTPPARTAPRPALSPKGRAIASPTKS